MVRPAFITAPFDRCRSRAVVMDAAALQSQLPDFLRGELHAVRRQRVAPYSCDELRLVVGANLETAVAAE
jgi:hypothetical protein